MAQIYENFEWRQYRTTRDTSNANFSGEVIWDWVLGGNRNHLWDESYIMCDLSISENSIALTKTAAELLLYGINNNAMACLFKNGMYRINDKVISKINDFAQTSTVLRTAYSGYGENKQSLSGNPMHFYDRTETKDTRHSLDDAGAVTLVSGEQYVRISNAKLLGVFNGQTVIRLEMKLPFFLQKEIKALPPNTRHQLALQVDSLWKNNLVHFGVGKSTGTAVAIGTVNLSISNLILWSAQYESVPVSPSDVFRTSYVDIFSTIKNMTSAVEQFQLTIPRGTNKILVGFYNSQQLDNTSPNYFGNSEVWKLTRMRMAYDGQYFPQPDYVFSNTFITGDTKRAYNDYIRATQSLMSDAGSTLTYGEWLSHPLFCFRIHRVGGSQANTLEVELNFSSAPTNTNIWIGCMYDKELEIKYNELLQVSDVNITEDV